MTDDEMIEAQSDLAAVAFMIGHEVSEEGLELFVKLLHDVSLQDFKRALYDHQRDPERGRFFPKPADIIYQIEGTGSDAALLAWNTFVAALERIGAGCSVMFADPAISRTVKELRLWNPDGWTEYEERRLQDSFMAAYKRHRGTTRNVRLIGRWESENGRYLEHFKPTRGMNIGHPEQTVVIGEGGQGVSPTEARKLLEPVLALGKGEQDVIKRLREMATAGGKA